MVLRNSIKRLSAALTLWVCWFAVSVNAQQTSLRPLSKTLPAAEFFAGGEVSFDLDGAALGPNVGGFGVRVESLPSGLVIDNTGLTEDSVVGAPSWFVIRFGKRNPPVQSDDRVRVTVYPRSAPPAAQDDKELRSEAARLRDELAYLIEQDAKSHVAYAKTSKERRLYLSGGFREAELSANAVLHSWNVWRLSNLLSQIDLGATLDRGSGSRSDPDFLNVGINFRKIFPLHRRAIANEVSKEVLLLTPLSEAGAGGPAPSVESLRRGFMAAREAAAGTGNAFFRAIVITPLSPRLETNLHGLSSSFVANFINGSDVQLRTGAVPVFGSNKLTWSMKLTPLSLETGVALRNPDDPGRRGSPLVRLNTGGVGKLTFQPCRVDLIFNRVELELSAVNRHLFNDESAFDRLTQKANGLVRGNKYATQADFRIVFGFLTPVKYFHRRPAITVTYKNGFFPPLYAYNNAVSVHFTLESDDDHNFSEMKLHVEEVRRLREGTTAHN